MSRKLYWYHERLSFLRHIKSICRLLFLLLSVKSDALPFSPNGILTQPLRYLVCDHISNWTTERAHEHLPPRRMNPDNEMSTDLNPGDRRCSTLRSSLWVLLYSPGRGAGGGQPDAHHVPTCGALALWGRELDISRPTEGHTYWLWGFFIFQS